VSIATALESWRTATRNHREFILTSPEGHAVHHQATAVINELTAAISDLMAQADEARGIQVILCTERDSDYAMIQNVDVPEGTVLRTTDTFREWVHGGPDTGWQERKRDE
jgi:hypothetical protein